MQATFAKHGYDPVEALIKLATDPQTERKLQARIHADLLQYVAPRLKASEQIVETDQRVRVNILKFSAADFAPLPRRPVHEIPLDVTPTLSSGPNALPLPCQQG